MAKCNTIIGTWNVRTLYASGKVQELEHAMSKYSWDIIGLSETQWTGFGETTTDDGHKIWFSGESVKHQHGVGLLVKKERAQSVISCIPINSRLIHMRLEADPLNVSLIQVYAPTSTYDDEEVERFYEELENAIMNITITITIRLYYILSTGN